MVQVLICDRNGSPILAHPRGFDTPRCPFRNWRKCDWGSYQYGLARPGALFAPLWPHRGSRMSAERTS